MRAEPAYQTSAAGRPTPSRLSRTGCACRFWPEADLRIPCKGFDLYVEAASVDWLEEAEVDFEEDTVGGQLVVKAPNIRGSMPGEDAPLREDLAERGRARAAMFDWETTARRHVEAVRAVMG